MAVEAPIALTNSAIAKRGLPRAPSGTQGSQTLGKAGVLRAREAKLLVDWIKFRNLIVHHYAKIDLGLVHDRLVRRRRELYRLGLAFARIHRDELGDVLPRRARPRT